MSQIELSLGLEIEAVAKPFVKWCGGKRRLMPELLKHCPDTINHYVEPFLGGGALFWELQRKHPAMTAQLSDLNGELVSAYRAIRSCPKLVIDELLFHESKHHEDHFFSVRALVPSDFLSHKIAARFIYLNKAGFNGLYRVNQRGEFNVPFGKNPKPKILDEPNILACSAALKNARIDWEPFQKGFDDFPADTFIYLDPPYDGTFTAYQSEGFRDHDQVRVRDYALKLVNLGHKVMISNSDTALIRGLYSPEEFTIHEVTVNRSVSAKSATRGPVKELLITTY